MPRENLDGPDKLELNVTPPGIVRYRRLPILIAAVAFTGVVVFLIFNMAQKQKAMQETQQAMREQKPLTTVTMEPRDTENWLDDEK